MLAPALRRCHVQGMKWLLVVTSLTGMSDLDRETVFHEFESEAACQSVAERLSGVMLQQQEGVERVFAGELPALVRPVNFWAAFCTEIPDDPAG